MSAFASVVGLFFVCIGLGVLSILPSEAPWFIKAFMGFWTLGAGGVCLYHLANAFSTHGVANEIIDVSDLALPPEPASPERRLQRLTELRAKQLISEREYQAQRRIIINDV